MQVLTSDQINNTDHKLAISCCEDRLTIFPTGNGQWLQASSLAFYFEGARVVTHIASFSGFSSTCTVPISGRRIEDTSGCNGAGSRYGFSPGCSADELSGFHTQDRCDARAVKIDVAQGPATDLLVF